VSSELFSNRGYRALHGAGDLRYFRVTVGETDLSIGAKAVFEAEARAAALAARDEIYAEIDARPRFKSSLEPLNVHGTETPVAAAMLSAARAAGVGPMAAVAGAVAEHVGRALSALSDEVIVENGGDVFLFGRRERTVAIYAAESPLSDMLGVAVLPGDGMGVCTSSGTVGHSLSLGRADAAVVIARSCALADAAATRLGNLVSAPEDIESALELICGVKDVLGALVIIGDRMGAKGDVRLKLLKRKK
jgi:ApbE superfamily uncharacterized protein (UPF0280 family)